MVGMTAVRLACLILMNVMGFGGGSTHQRQEMYEYCIGIKGRAKINTRNSLTGRSLWY